METTSTVTLQDTIETLLKSKKYATLRDILTTMNPVDIAAIFEELQDEKIPEKASEKIEQEIKEKEGQNIISHIKKDSYVIALDLTGKELNSVALSQKIENLSISNSSITFIIGGSLGLSKQVLNYCNEKLCFSKMTFPHQLIRIFLLEQIYRAFKIANNETYHK